MKHARADYDRIQDPAGLIPDDEPVFLIRGKDACGPSVVFFWAEQAARRGASEAIVSAALRQAKLMDEWQNQHGAKVPDMPEGSGNLADAKSKDLPTEARADGVKVKELEWFEADFKYAPFDGPEVVLIFEGHGVGRRFATIVQCDDGEFTLLSDPTCQRFKVLDAAKAAAQADYEVRIRSALTLPSSTAQTGDA